MNVWRRILAAVALLLSAAGLLLSLAGGVGVWVVKGPATAKATKVFGRVEAALDVADKGLGQVRKTLERAATRLDGVREEQRKLAAEPGQINVAKRVLARTVRQKIAPEVADANEKLHTVAEAAVVVNSVLEDVGNLPFLSVKGMDLGGLTAMNNRLADVAPAAWELSRLLGEPAPATEDADNQLSKVDRTLKTLRGLIDEYEPQLTEVRLRTEELKSTTLLWITPTAVLLSLACAWIALSQMCVFFRAWSWWRP